MRVELQQKNIKKSGRNKFAGYDYFELSDILPPINELQAKYKTCSFVSFNSEEATLKIVNAEDPKEDGSSAEAGLSSPRSSSQHSRSPSPSNQASP